MTARLIDWPELLAAFVESRRDAPFSWGGNDCCLFAADAVQAMTGTDPAADVRGTYSTALAAAHLLDELGGVEAIAAARLGPEVPVALAGRGDAVAIDAGQGMSLGIYIGAHVAVPAADGLAFLPVAQAARAWRI